MSEKTWLRDALHDLRKYAQERNLTEADDALRIAIIRVSVEADIPTLLSIADLSKPGGESPD
ncbi:MAG: hypothetical protein HKO95_05315 [Rhodobacteraceae bacterium]|jgi:hypothetical protein|nr:hypothetical protein [Alphaproteobacteria bacterium]MBT8476857.1 hypothetical protein [Alphaproteobacteria bacterium]NNK66134.1 hypothetical protein [Paracoccaceae bacterium]